MNKYRYEWYSAIDNENKSKEIGSEQSFNPQKQVTLLQQSTSTSGNRLTRSMSVTYLLHY